MIRERGNMWDIERETDLFCITTNAYIRSDERLVMGRGIAREAMTRWPELPIIAGRKISHLGCYGLLQLKLPSLKRALVPMLGLFQVKRHWAHAAELELIAYSTGCLEVVARNNPHMRIDLNFPGVGNGKLKQELVLPIIERLPDNVHVWTFR